MAAIVMAGNTKPTIGTRIEGKYAAVIIEKLINYTLILL